MRIILKATISMLNADWGNSSLSEFQHSLIGSPSVSTMVSFQKLISSFADLANNSSSVVYFFLPNHYKEDFTIKNC